MKVLILKIVLLVSFIGLTAQSTSSNANKAGNNDQPKIKWYSIEEAVALNAREPRKIFIDVYTDWCGWCKRMDATTFTDPEVVAYMNKHYYPVKLNAETNKEIVLGDKKYVNPNPNGRRSSHQLAVSLLDGKMSYPSYVFLNEKNEKLTVVKGYLKVPDFKPIISYFGSNAYLSSEWEEYKASYNK